MQRTGRPTTDPKTNIIRIRINDTQHQHLIQEAQKRGITLSEYLRGLIRMDIHNSRTLSKR